MTESPESAPAGWYDDPNLPGRLRYFDGTSWTNHFHSPDQAPDIGSWINSTFSVFATHWRGAAVIAFGATLVGNLVAWFSIRAVFNDVSIVDENLRNFSSSKAAALGLLAVFGIVWQGLGWLALNRFMQRAHHQAEPTIAEAVGHSVRRLPKYLGVVLVLAATFALIGAIVVALAVTSPLLAILVLLLLIVAAVWVYVKLVFLPAAIVAAPADAAVLQASAAVSAGRFWAIAGRVIIFTIGLVIASNIVAAVLGDYGSAVDSESLVGVVEVVDEELVVNDLQLRDLFPSTGTMLVIMVITSVTRAVTAMISTSAFMRLYLDVGAPSEV